MQSPEGIINAAIAAVGVVIAALIAWRGQWAIKRNDVAAAGLTAQIDGWRSLLIEYREDAKGLRAELKAQGEDCDRRISILEAENDRCRSDIAELRRMLSARP